MGINISSSPLRKSSFKYDCLVGTGGLSHVYKVHCRKDGAEYALKEIPKSWVLQKKSVYSIMNERKILELLKHPFIVNMHFAFQDPLMLYLVLDYKAGGTLRYHMNHRFTEDESKFLIACLVLGLEYLHINNILHKDIKPENIVLDSQGYAHLTDFGIAEFANSQNSFERSGTLGYMAPEVMCRLNASTASDYFAIGVILYEFITGHQPFEGATFAMVRDAMMTNDVKLTRRKVPQGWSLYAVDFVNKLLERRVDSRMGAHGAHEVKAHAWLRDVKWDALMVKKAPAPFIPPTGDNFCKGKPPSASLLKSPKNAHAFRGYDYTSSTPNSTQ